MIDVKCKKCRRMKEKLFLKSGRCMTAKCAMVKKSQILPVNKGKRKTSKITVYGRQLLEKQKIKQTYGIGEKQFKKYFLMASRKKGVTPRVFANILELRFDNIVFKMGFAPSKSIARQLVNHGHFLLNNKRHTIASSILKIGDTVSIRIQSRQKSIFQEIINQLSKVTPPKHLSLDVKKIEGKVISEPNLEELKLPFNFSAIVEFYSK